MARGCWSWRRRTGEEEGGRGRLRRVGGRWGGTLTAYSSRRRVRLVRGRCGRGRSPEGIGKRETGRASLSVPSPPAPWWKTRRETATRRSSGRRSVKSTSLAPFYALRL